MPRIFTIASGFAVGALLVYLQSSLVPGTLIAVVAAVFVPFLRSKPILFVVSILVGLYWANIYSMNFLASGPDQHFLNLPVVAIGSISGIPVNIETFTQFYFRLQHISRADELQENAGMVRLRWHGDPPILKPGQIWKMTVKSRAPRGYRNEGVYDGELDYFRKHIRATGYVLKHGN